MVFADTDLLVAFLRSDPQAADFISNEESQGNTISISSVSAMELFLGAQLHIHKQEKLKEVKTILENLEIKAFNLRTAQECARIMGLLKMKGNPIGLADAQIASTALEHGLEIVTRNTREFSRIPGLQVRKW